MECIAVTGCAGLIGSHIANKYLELGYLVIGIDSLIGGYRTNLPVHNNFEFFELDIGNTETIKAIFEKYNPATVVHCAALAHEGLSVFSPKTITESIYTGTVSVASAAISSGVSLFVNTSSMARYGNIEPPFREEDIPNPVDPYGLAKLQAEQQLNLLSDIHGIKVFHVVPHNVCGPNQCYSDPFRNVLSIFTNRVVHDKPIFVYGTGEQKRSFSHVDDCVEAYVTLINEQNSIHNKSVFNIGPDDGSEITINELAKQVHRLFNKEPRVEYLPSRPREVINAWVSTTKSRDVIRYRTNKTTEDTISDTVNWIKTSPELDFNYHLNLEIVNESTPKPWLNKLFNS